MHGTGRIESTLLLGDGVETRCFALTLAQIVKAGATNAAMAQYLDLLQTLRVYWEDSLDSHTIGNLAHRKRGAIAAPVDPDDNAFERLDALLFAFTNLDLEAYGVANAKCGKIRSASVAAAVSSTGTVVLIRSSLRSL